MKKYAIVFLSLFLVVSLPFSAHANIVTATGKYIINAVKHAPGGAKVHATNTATGAKHVIKHGVSSADLGKGIGAGIVGGLVGGGLGLVFQAITGLALDAVDWVMDKENNQIKWKEKGGGGGGQDYSIFAESELKTPSYSGLFGARSDSLCRKSLAKQYPHWVGSFDFLYDSSIGDYGSCVVDRVGVSLPFKPVDLGGDIDWQYVPWTDLATKIIDLADGGNAVAQKDIEDYVTHLAKEGELDDELDNATDITKPEGTEPEPEPPIKCPPNTVNVEGVCIGKSDTDESLWCNSTDFSKKICDWIDWTQVKPDELEKDAGKVDVTDKSKDLNIDQNRIDFSNQCPAPTPINTSVGGFPVSTELNYQPLCDFFTMLNPFVIGMGGISSALIIAGGARRG